MKIGDLVLAETDGGILMQGILTEIEGKWSRILCNGRGYLVLTSTLEKIHD